MFYQVGIGQIFGPVGPLPLEPITVKSLGRSTPPAKTVVSSLGRAPKPGVTSSALALVAPPRVAGQTTTLTPKQAVQSPSAKPTSSAPAYVKPAHVAPSEPHPQSSPIVGGGTGGGGGGDAGAPAYVPYAPGPGPSNDVGPLEQSAGPALEQSTVSASVDLPWEMWAGLAVLGAATVVGVVYVATRHQGPKRKRAAT